MWQLKTPQKVKLIIGILAADKAALELVVETIKERFGALDIVSDSWPFTQTDYYKEQTGPNILRQFVSIKRPISPGRLAKIKLKTNRIEQSLAQEIDSKWPRPVNLDPGIIEPSKLILASTKNFSHRIYIGKKIYAELTLNFDKGGWRSFEYTYPDYKSACYLDFFDRARNRLLGQLKCPS